MKINLKKEYFVLKEVPFVQGEKLSAELFKYDSGICAVKLNNPFGYITVLPFDGQMIWDAVFNGRSLKMKTPYTQPRNVESFLDTYGCYMMHCGARTMGCPGPDDTHKQHGELPYAKYDSASIIEGEDEKGKFIGITGTYEYNRAFGDRYIAMPAVKLYEDSSIIHISIKIENLSNKPMEMMYLCHINNRSVSGGRIVQSLPWNEENMELRYSIPNTVSVDEKFLNFLTEIQNNIQVTEKIHDKDVYNPEIVFFLHNQKSDENGWTHYMYVHPDGSADYTSYKPKDLDHAARWIVRTESMEALGLALPSTADAEGYLAEKAKGNIKIIKPKESFETEFMAGYIDADEVAEVEKKINSISST